MQRPGREAALRQMGVELRKIERENRCLERNPVPSRQELTQLPDDVRALTAWSPGPVE